MTPIDWLVVGGYVVAILVVGIRFGDASDTHVDYFLAGRRERWAAVAASTWATKLSALTFIGVPGAAIAGNFTYVQLWFGTFLAAYLVAKVFIPEFYRYRVETVYAYLEKRVGIRARLSGTLIFIVSRCLASAVRLTACAIAVAVFFDVPLNHAIVLIASLAAVYVLFGGLRAVIWTDVVQLILFLAGAVLAIAFVGMALPGGFLQIIEVGAANDKFRAFDFSLDATSASTFWTGNLFALLLGLATGATDQDVAQRALSCPDAREAKTAVVWAGACDLLSSLLFLGVGVAIFAYYQVFPSEAVVALIAEGRSDHVFPHFIRHELPAGLRGALVAALLAAAMSSLDSALSGLASSAYFDLGLTRNTLSDRVHMGPRLLVAGFAIVLILIAQGFGAQPSILWFGLSVMGYTYGALLGLFVIAAALRNHANDTSSMLGALSSILVVILATRWGLVPWPWSVAIGAGWTCAFALVISDLMKRARSV